MNTINANISELLLTIKKIQEAISSIKTTKNMLISKYKQLSYSWNDKKFYELEQTVQDCLKAFNDILKILLQNEKNIALLIQSIQQYDNIKFGNNNEDVVNITQSSNNISNIGIKQTKHKDLISNKAEQIIAIIEDMKNTSNIEISKSEAEEILNSLHDYTGPYYSDIRYAYKNPSAPIGLKKSLQYIDKYIHNAPKWEGQVFRGINISDSVANQIISSTSVDMLGPSSWSTSEDVAQRFADGNEPIRMLFILDNNVSGVSVTHIATYDGIEEEVLSPSGVKYIIDRIVTKLKNGRKYIYVYVHE